jgi:hypothetical protein
VAFEQVNVRQPFGVNGDPLLVHLSQNRFAHPREVSDDRVPGEGIKKVECLVRNVINRFDQEVTGTHSRVENLDVKEFVYETAPFVFNCRPELVLARGLSFSLGKSHHIPMPFLRLAQFRTHGLEFFLKHRSDSMFHNVLHDIVRRVV